MLKRFAFTALLGLCLGLAACSALAPEPTATPVPSATALPSDTPAPTPTVLVPTATLDIFAELNPVDPPLAKWNGVRIMPGALLGGGDDRSYYFTTQATLDDIQAFYDQEMARLGYSSLAVGKGQNDTLVLFYESDSGTLSISLFSKGDTVLVMMVK